jgi:CheY-like chemotaxis protein
MRILVVDKLASFRRRIRSWLVDGGHSPEGLLEAPGCDAAIAILRKEDFKVDVILCEWDLGTVRAHDLVRQIRSVPGFAHIGFFAVGPPSPAEQIAATRAGASAYLHQPLDPDVLLQALVEFEKKAIARRKHIPSPTPRFRILANDAKPQDRQATRLNFSGSAEAELRQGAKTEDLAKGATLEIGPDGPLYWVVKGSLSVRETRADGTTLEYRLGPGQFLGEATWGGFAIAGIEARAEDNTRVASRDGTVLEAMRPRHPVLFYSLRNIANERARKHSRAQDRRPAERALSGELDSLPAGDLMQILTGARKTGVLRIAGPKITYFFQFVEGALRHAEAEGRVGADVFYEAIALEKGTFEFMAGPAIEGPITVAGDTTTLLLEGLRRRNEQKSAAPKTRETSTGPKTPRPGSRLPRTGSSAPKPGSRSPRPGSRAPRPDGGPKTPRPRPASRAPKSQE